MSFGMINFIYIVSLMLNIALAALVISKSEKNKVNLSFSAILFLNILWIYFSYMAHISVAYNMDLALLWTRLGYASLMPIPALIVYFSKIFPKSNSLRPWLLLSIFAPVPLFLSLVFSDLIIYSLIGAAIPLIAIKFGSAHFLFVIYFITYFAWALLTSITKYVVLRRDVRRQAYLVFLGMAIPGFIIATSNLLLPLLGVSLGWYLIQLAGPVSTVAFTALVSYAIFKYRFMGINVFLGKGLVYTILAALVSAVYFSAIHFISLVSRRAAASYSVFIDIAFFFFFAVIFETLRDRVQQWVDRLFFRTKLDYEKTLRETSSAMSILTDTDRLLKITTRVVKRRMNLTAAALFLYQEDKDRFEIVAADGLCKDLIGYTMSANYPLIESMEETKKYIKRVDVENKASDVFISDYERNNYHDILADLRKIRVSLCVPAIIKNRLVAFLALGEKLNGDHFDDLDLNFLSTLANQSAIFIENVSLIEKEKEGAKKIAEAQAREKYTAMLENVNKELLNTREELVKAERLSTLTKLAVSLQHEINNPLTAVLAQSQALLMKINSGETFPTEFAKDRAKTIEMEAKRIKELLRNLANISEPIIREYMPGVEMIDIAASVKEQH